MPTVVLNAIQPILFIAGPVVACFIGIPALRAIAVLAGSKDSRARAEAGETLIWNGAGASLAASIALWFPLLRAALGV